MYVSSPYTGAGWRCSTCQSSNNANAVKCTACGKPAPESSQQNNRSGMTQQQSTRGGSTTPLPPNATSTPGSRSASQQLAHQQYTSSTNNNNNTIRQQQQQQRTSPVPMMAGMMTGNTPPPPFAGGGGGGNSNTNPQNPQSQFSGFANDRSSSRTPPPGPALSPFPTTASNNKNQNNNNNSSTPTPMMNNPLHHGGTPSSYQQTPLANSTIRRSPSTRTTVDRAQQEAEASASGFNHPMQKREYEMEIEFLRNAINESKKYGMEIEHTVEYLTDLLRRKTLECESLRTLASENYEPVRRAIAEQYKSQKRVEKNAQNELKYFQGRIETLYSERTMLVQENVKLKEKIAEVERKLLVAQTRQSRPDDDSFFNRILYDNTDKPPYQEFRVHVSNPQAPLMTLLTQIPPKRCKDLQKMRALEIAKIMLEPDIASRLYKFGFFNYLHHLFTILLTDQKTTPESFAVDISTAYKRYVEYAKNPPDGVSHAKNQHFKEKITKLYQAFMPDQVQELNGLLTLHRNNEADLWASVIQNMADVFEEREKAAGRGGVTDGHEASPFGGGTERNEKLSFLDDDEEGGGSPRFSRSAFPEDERGRAPGDLNYDFGKDKNTSNKENDDGDVGGKDDDEEDNDHSPFYDSVSRGSALLSRADSMSPGRTGGGNRSASPMSNHSDITEEHIDLHTRIILMFAKYNPQKLYSKELQRTMEKYPPEVLLTALKTKYGGDEPTGLERKKLLEEIAKL